MDEAKEKTLYDKFAFCALIFWFSGVFGFIYEELFYRIDLGYFVKRGTTFGPWIPIYGFGGVLIFLLSQRFKRFPPAVFALSALISGVLEFATGYVIYEFRHTRLWDYNTEMWNWGNVGGFICARSVIFFGASGLILLYAVNPILESVKKRISDKAFAAAALAPASLFVLDICLALLLK